MSQTKTRFVIRCLVCATVLCSGFLQGQSTSDQQKRPLPTTSLAQEFPVTMQQKVIAGKTPVGTKVAAKLTIATLVKGKVIPTGAIFSGEVVESEAKSANGPSRLAIRMNDVRWKTGSLAIQVYLTNWYYPLRMSTADDPANDPRYSRSTQIATYPPNSPHGTFPGPPVPEDPGTAVSDTRVVMKDVESARQSNGDMLLTSIRLNLKLDKTMTYVLATGDLTPAK
jgi:hypothetical protein